jgi:creatinine amidohydrolase
MTKAERAVPAWLTGYSQIGIAGPVRFGWSSADLSDNGVIGDPTGASPEKGRLLFEEMTRSLTAQLAEVSRFEFETKSTIDPT